MSAFSNAIPHKLALSSCRRLANYFLVILAIFLPGVASAYEFSFTPSDSDYSVIYLSNIFGTIHNGILVGTPNSLIGGMFGTFNSAILALASILLIYTILVATLNTAHEGEVMGKKWSSIWIPVRTFAGIGMLVPQSSGYSIIQVVVMWIVLQGVGAANTLWNTVLGQLNAGSTIVQQSMPIDKTMATNQVAGMFRSMVCLYGLQNTLNKSAQTNGIAAPILDQIILTVPGGSGDTDADWNQFLQDMKQNAQNLDPKSNGGQAWANSTFTSPTNPFASGTDNGKYQLRFPTIPSGPYASLDGVCGKMLWNNGQNLAGMRQVGIQQILLILSAPARYLANSMCTTDFECTSNQKCLISGGAAYKAGTGTLKWCACMPGDATCTATNPALPPDLFITATQVYQAFVQPILQSYFTGSVNKEFLTDAKNYGWILAGRYYFDITRLNNIAQGIMSDPSGSGSTPTPNSPTDLTNAINNSQAVAGTGDYTLPLVYPKGNVDQYVAAAIATANSMNNTQDSGQFQNITFVSDLRNYIDNSFASNLDLGTILGPLLDGLGGIVASLQALGQGTANPVILLSQMGNGMLQTAVYAWLAVAVGAGGIALLLGFFPSAVPSNGILALVGIFAPFFTVLLTVFFLVGALLAYYVPLVPLILFTFGAIGWIIAVIESMVAAPLVAFGIAYPEQHEAFGRAEPAVMLIINIFLRPMLMIFGLIAGIILSYIGIWVLNAGFGYAVSSIADSANAYSLAKFLFPLAIIVVYAATVMAIVNQSFTLITAIPDRVTRWLSGGLQEQFGGGAEKALGEVQSVASQGGQRLSSTGETSVGESRKAAEGAIAAKSKK